jgi:hypothetical protein
LALQYQSDALRADRGMVLAAVGRHGSTLRFADPSLQGDREVVLAAVTADGSALCYASRVLQADRTVVATAVKQCPKAIDYADPGLLGIDAEIEKLEDRLDAATRAKDGDQRDNTGEQIEALHRCEHTDEFHAEIAGLEAQLDAAMEADDSDLCDRLIERIDEALDRGYARPQGLPARATGRPQSLARLSRASKAAVTIECAWRGRRARMAVVSHSVQRSQRAVRRSQTIHNASRHESPGTNDNNALKILVRFFFRGGAVYGDHKPATRPSIPPLPPPPPPCASSSRARERGASVATTISRIMRKRKAAGAGRKLACGCQQSKTGSLDSTLRSRSSQAGSWSSRCWSRRWAFCGLGRPPRRAGCRRLAPGGEVTCPPASFFCTENRE